MSMKSATVTLALLSSSSREDRHLSSMSALQRAFDAEFCRGARRRAPCGRANATFARDACPHIGLRRASFRASSRRIVERALLDLPGLPRKEGRDDAMDIGPHGRARRLDA